MPHSSFIQNIHGDWILFGIADTTVEGIPDDHGTIVPLFGVKDIHDVGQSLRMFAAHRPAAKFANAVRRSVTMPAIHKTLLPL
jgi:hypothetical protein